MKKMKIVHLKIRNFKGIINYSVDFKGKSATVFGDNATGKTSLYDAVLWLLFDQDSQGNRKFCIKPLAANGAARQAGIMPTVEALFWVDGQPLRLKKALRERWGKQRNTMVKRFLGNTTDFWVNEEPYTETEFKRVVHNLLEEELFRCLSHTAYFCEQLDWKRRREWLWELGKVQTEVEILQNAPQFAELEALLGDKSVDGYQSLLMERNRKLRAIRDHLPVRIDECQKTMEKLLEINFYALQQKEAALAKQESNLSAQLVKLENRTLVAQKQAELGAKETELRTLELENQAYRQSQAQPDVSKAVEAELAVCQRELERVASEQTALTARGTAAQRAMREAETRYAQWKSAVFTAKEICSYCGQPLPTGSAVRARTAFQKEQKRQMEHAEQNRRLQCGIVQECKKGVEKRLDAQRQWEQKLREAQLHREQAQSVQVVLDLDGFAVRCAQLKQDIQTLKSEIDSLQKETGEVRAKLTAQKNEAALQLAKVRETLATKRVLEQTQERMQELRMQEAHNRKSLEELERKMALCQDFVRYRTECVMQAIHASFDNVRFRLFRENITNDGLQQCCEPMVGGVPYSALNHAAQVNAGLEIIRAFHRVMNISVPIFVDNAEGVTKMLEAETQMIRLVVSAQDASLRLVLDDGSEEK